MALDDIELWVTEHYGKVTFDDVVFGWVEIHVACVPVMNGIAIGMGENRQLAIWDLYHDLTRSKNGPPLPLLPFFWHERRSRKNQEGS